MNENKPHIIGLTPEKALTMLDEISPTFCLAKWLQVTLNLHTGTNASCCLTPPSQVKLQKLEENLDYFHNTEENLADRDDLLKGIKTKSCQFCWDQEMSSGKLSSERIYKSASPWAYSNKEKVLKAQAHEMVAPSYLEVSFSSKCNLRCAYCSPQTSSSIYNEIKKFGPYLDSQKYGDLTEIDSKFDFSKDESQNPYIPKFKNWFAGIRSDLNVLRFTGGEPLLSENVFLMLEELKTKPLPSLNLEINSNLALSQSSIIRFVNIIKSIPRENYKTLRIITSIDTGFKDAEYIRNGLNSTIFKENVKRILTQLPDVEMRFTVTFNILSLFSFKELLHYVLDLKAQYKTYDKILLSIYPLISPYYLSLKILPNDFYYYFDDIYAYMLKHKISEEEPFGFNEYEVDSFERVKNFFHDTYPQNLKKRLQKDFYYFIKDYDQRKNLNVQTTFPDLRKFLLDCYFLVIEEWNLLYEKKVPTIEDYKKLILFYQRDFLQIEGIKEKIYTKIVNVIDGFDATKLWDIIKVTQEIFQAEKKIPLYKLLLDRIIFERNKEIGNSQAIPEFIQEFSKNDFLWAQKRYLNTLVKYLKEEVLIVSEELWGWIEVFNNLQYEEEKAVEILYEMLQINPKTLAPLKLIRSREANDWLRIYKNDQSLQHIWIHGVLNLEDDALFKGFLKGLDKIEKESDLTILWVYLLSHNERIELLEYLKKIENEVLNSYIKEIITQVTTLAPSVLKRIQNLKKQIKSDSK